MTNWNHRTFGLVLRLALLCLLTASVLPLATRAQAPVFAITKQDSSVKFFVKASVALEGTFDKWDAALTFTSPDISTGVLSVKIQADSVNSGSGMKESQHL
jgi:polyisoprenoid-binding protein YceI